jgi:hypothetical protein
MHHSGGDRRESSAALDQRLVFLALADFVGTHSDLIMDEKERRCG